MHPMSAPARRPIPAAPTCLLTPEDVKGAADADLSETIAVLQAEQARRAVEAGDPEALADQAFHDAFDRTGKPNLPYLHAGLLICPGGKSTKSRTSHDCVFVAVGEDWVWDYADILFDDMRTLPGSKWMQTVSVLPAIEGLELDVVTSQARQGGKCQMVSARSFTIRHGALEETQVRTRSLSGHR